MSSDLNRYIGFAPDNMVYDKSARTYVRGPGFEPVFDKQDSARYLAQLRSVTDGILDHEDCWIAGRCQRRRKNQPSAGAKVYQLKEPLSVVWDWVRAPAAALSRELAVAGALWPGRVKSGAWFS